MNERAEDDKNVVNEWERESASSETNHSGAGEIREIRVQPRVGVSNQVEPEMVSDVESEEEVTRLVRAVEPGKERIKVAKAKFEKLDDQLDEAEKQEQQWGQSASMSLRSVLIGGSMVIVLVVVLVAMRGVLRGDSVTEAQVIPLIENQKVDPYEGSPEKWFRHRSGIIETEAMRVMKGYIDAPDDQARSQWVRQPELYLKRIAQSSFVFKPLLEQRQEQSWSIGHTGETAYLIFGGRNHDYLPFQAYFTQHGEQLKLDWFATAAWSDVSLQAIRADALRRSGAVSDAQRIAGVVDASQLSPSPKSALPAKIHTESVVLRCMIRKKDDFYAGPYNDRDYSAYMLLSADKMHHLWGYAVRGSELDLKLKGILDHGSFIVALKKDEKVTLRVRMAKKEALPSQIELVELEHPEWVTP